MVVYRCDRCRAESETPSFLVDFSARINLPNVDRQGDYTSAQVCKPCGHRLFDAIKAAMHYQPHPR